SAKTPHRHNHQATNPENLTPNTMATPVWRPMLAKSPTALYLNGSGARPTTAASMFFAAAPPCRKPCCPVGGQSLPVVTSGTAAQSPAAQSPLTPGTARYSLTRTRPRSFSRGDEAIPGVGLTPPCRMRGDPESDVPSANVTIEPS